MSKGKANYINIMRKKAAWRTILMFALCFIIFISGYLYYKSRENIVTVIAVLGVLPSSMSLVNLIMFLRYHSMDIERLTKLQSIFEKNKVSSANIFFDSIMTIEGGGSYHYDCFLCVNGLLIGLSGKNTSDLPLIEKHIKNALSRNEIEGITVKLYSKEESFIQKALQLCGAYDAASDNERDKKAIALIGALSL